jgi:hypothetical protein
MVVGLLWALRVSAGATRLVARLVSLASAAETTRRPEDSSMVENHHMLK